MSENPERSNSAKMAGSGWTRPQAMRKDQNRTAWLVLFGLVCLGVATWGVLNGLYWKRRERVERAALDMAKRESDSFVAIAYGGVTTNPEPGGDFVSTKRFASQLDALMAAGYTPITLDDVARFYRKERLLPAKSLLITFENSRRSSYFTTSSLLEKRRWHAVMGVVTDDVRKEVEGVILAPYLEHMKSSPSWDLAAESDHGTGEVTASADGRTAMFFSAPAWLPDLSRFETLEEFDRRIRADHAAAVSFFTNTLRCAARAFFFPMGNYGQFESHNKPLREANLKAVEDFYEMGFITSATTTPSPTRAASRGSRWIPRGAPTSWCASLTVCGRARYPAAGTTRRRRATWERKGGAQSGVSAYETLTAPPSSCGQRLQTTRSSPTKAPPPARRRW